MPNLLIYCWPKPIFIVTRYLCNQDCPRTGGLDLVFFTIYSQESTTAFVTCWWRITQLGKVKMNDSSKPQGTTKLYTSYFFNQTKYFRNASLCFQGDDKYHQAAWVKFSGFIVNAEGRERRMNLVCVIKWCTREIREEFHAHFVQILIISLA